MNRDLPDIKSWLPISKKEMDQRGWEQPDIILVTGDAYVDHPSFGTAVVGRILEASGYKVAVMPQPNWRDDLRDFKKFGAPRLFFGISSGNMDSMVNHYTAGKRIRSDDAYTAGGNAGYRPDYATSVYSKILRSLFPEVPLVIGGIEASLRRFTHYDYWSDQLKPSMLHESGADLLVYGMGEKPIVEIAAALDSGKSIKEITDIPQTAWTLNEGVETTEEVRTYQMLHSHEACLHSKQKFAENFKVIESNSNLYHPDGLRQATGQKMIVVNKPYPLTTTAELDNVYKLPFTRLPHPRYKKRGDVPAFEMIRNSVNIHRGCFGACSFCTISAHQGRFISSRSESSIVDEVKMITGSKEFRGTLTDLGGPSANMYRMQGADMKICYSCKRPSCIFPRVCKNLNADHKPLTQLYQKVKSMNRVKHLFIGSGIRYDMLVGQGDELTNKFGLNAYTKNLVQHHTSGRLKVAPEHSADDVLKSIRKPPFKQYLEFRKLFYKINKESGLKQQLIPYLISSLPGCRPENMAELAADLADTGYQPEQVQDFTPTPMTLSTVIYYTGIDPYTMEKVFVPRKKDQKETQRKFFFYYKRENKDWLIRKLREYNRPDLMNRIFRKNA